jgi:hypothetical protein
MTTSQNLLQKTSFSTTSEFLEWLELVGEIADQDIKSIQVTPETYEMLVREWGSLRAYTWGASRYKATDTGLSLSCPWGIVTITK